MALAVFPELCLSGYAIEDLLQQDVLLDAVGQALRTLADATRTLLPVLLVGAPLLHRGRLFNTAAVIHPGPHPGRGAQNLPADLPRVFMSAAISLSGDGVTGEVLHLAGQSVPFGTDLLFEAAGPA